MWRYILLFLITIIILGSDGDGVWSVDEVGAEADSAWASISTDEINDNGAGSITITDDIASDSTLHVHIVNYAIETGTRSSSSRAAGNSNLSVTLNTVGGGLLGINQHNLDSIRLDSVLLLCNSTGDSIAMWRIDYYCREAINTGENQIITTFSGDSINFGTGETGYAYGTIPSSSNQVIEAPFNTWKCTCYWHNRSGGAITWVTLNWIMYLRAWYSK